MGSGQVPAHKAEYSHLSIVNSNISTLPHGFKWMGFSFSWSNWNFWAPTHTLPVPKVPKNCECSGHIAIYYFQIHFHEQLYVPICQLKAQNRR